MMVMHALFAQKTYLFRLSYVHLSVQDICSQIQDVQSQATAQV